MTHLLPPAPSSIRGDGRFRAILDRADGLDGVAPYHWPARPLATIVEAEPQSLIALLPKPPALPAVSPETARMALAMSGGFAASVALVMASGILHQSPAPAVSQDPPPVVAEQSLPAPSASRASAFAVPTLLPMLDTTATLVAELPKPVVTVQRTLAVRSVAVAQIPIAEDRSTQEAVPDGTSIALAEPAMRQEPVVQAEQPAKRRRQRARRAPGEQRPAPESAPDQAVAAAPQPPVRRDPWKYDNMRSALGLSFDKR